MNTSSKGWRLEGDHWVRTESLALTDRGVRFGMSVFETIGVRDGRPLLFDSHARLLASSAKDLLGIDFAPTHPLLGPADRGMLRIYVTAGDGGPADPVDKARAFALFESLSDNLPDLQTARLHQEPVAPFAHGAKTGNYWMQCAAQAAARREGFDHALLSGTEGHLLSGAMGNVFFVLEGALCTPASGLPVRTGVMREWVTTREKVQEVRLKALDLDNVEEAFLTNSRLGVMPLQIGRICPGPIGCALRDRCRREKIIP